MRASRTVRRVVRGLLVGALLAAAQAPWPALAASPQWQAVTLAGAQATELRAQSNGQRYRIFVAVPEGAPPPEGHPVLYVLDGNASFPVAAFVARSVARRSEVSGLQPPVVVGIGYPGDADFDFAARRRDYTVGLDREAARGAEDSGADLFLDFIEHELKPLLARQHRLDARRQALFGHSFGGLLVLHALLTRPDSFSTFVASSPSIWWRERRLLHAWPAAQATGCAGRAPRVQISVGALEDRIPPGRHSPATLALLASRPMVAEARQFAQRLQALPGWEGRVRYHELADEDHGFVWLPALSRGVEYFLSEAEPARKPSCDRL